MGIHLSSSEIEALRFALVVERDRVYTHADIDTLISGESVHEDIVYPRYTPRDIVVPYP